MTVAGITGPIEVGAVGPVNERDPYATEGVTSMVSPEFPSTQSEGASKKVHGTPVPDAI